MLEKLELPDVERVNYDAHELGQRATSTLWPAVCKAIASARLKNDGVLLTTVHDMSFVVTCITRVERELRKRAKPDPASRPCSACPASDC